MSLLNFHIPSRLVTGLDSLSKVGDFLRPWGERVVVLAESPLSGNEAWQQVLLSLERQKFKVVVYPDLDQIRTLDGIHNLLQKIRVSKPHAILAAGGIRTLSLARMVATLAPSKVSMERYLGGEVIAEPPVPVVDVPSSGRDPFCGREELMVHEAFLGRALVVKQAANPIKAVVFDPKLHHSLSPKQASVFLLDSLLHLCDILVSTHANPVSEANALAAASGVVHAARSLTSGRLELKTSLEVCHSGVLTSIAMASTGPGLGFAMTSTIHSRLGIPKSLVASILLPHLLETFSPEDARRFIPLAQFLGADQESNSPDRAAAQCAVAIRRLIAKLGLPGRLQELRVGQNSLAELSTLVAESPLIRHSPYQVNPSVVGDILRKAL